MKMRSLFLSLFLIVLALTSFGQNENEINLALGAKAPLTELVLHDINGEFVPVKKYLKENGIIVVFSCNTCPFVVGSDRFEGWEKQYNDLAQYAAENNIGFILINSNQAKRENEDSFEAMIKHAQKMNYTMPYLEDANSTMANAYGAKTTPHVYFFGGDFTLKYKGSIDNSWDSKRKNDLAYLRMAIAEMIDGNDVSIPETAPKGCSIKRI